MKRALGTVAGTLVGGTVGFGIGVLNIIPAMVQDTLAPVTYPIVGTIGGVLGAHIGQTDSSEYELVVTAAGAAGGFIGGASQIPVAPLHFLCRPITSPVFNTITGAAVGGIIGNQVAK